MDLYDLNIDMFASPSGAVQKRFERLMHLKKDQYLGHVQLGD